jgi:hypothetical protein
MIAFILPENYRFNMAEKMTWKEIANLYQNEWVLLEDYNWPEQEPDPADGKVLFHAPTREEFDKLLEKNDANIGAEVAIVYTGRPLISQKFRGGFGTIELRRDA